MEGYGKSTDEKERTVAEEAWDHEHGTVGDSVNGTISDDYAFIAGQERFQRPDNAPDVGFYELIPFKSVEEENLSNGELTIPCVVI